MKVPRTMIVVALALGGGASSAVGQDSAAEVVLLNGAHRVPAVAFGPSLPLLVGEFVAPSAAGEFYFIAEREAFFHAEIDAMGGNPTTNAVAGGVSAGMAASATAGAEVKPSPPPEREAPTWRSVGAHAFDLVHGGTVYSCFAGKISESDARDKSSLGPGAAGLSDPRLYKVQCMGWTTAE